jgi:hypothetical protein
MWYTTSWIRKSATCEDQIRVSEQRRCRSRHGDVARKRAHLRPQLRRQVVEDLRLVEGGALLVVVLVVPPHLPEEDLGELSLL